MQVVSGSDSGIEFGQGDEVHIAGLLCPLLELVGEAAGRQVEKAGTALGGEGIAGPTLAGAGEVITLKRRATFTKHRKRRYADRASLHIATHATLIDVPSTVQGALCTSPYDL